MHPYTLIKNSNIQFKIMTTKSSSDKDKEGYRFTTQICSIAILKTETQYFSCFDSVEHSSYPIFLEINTNSQIHFGISLFALFYHGCSRVRLDGLDITSVPSGLAEKDAMLM